MMKMLVALCLMMMMMLQARAHPVSMKLKFPGWKNSVQNTEVLPLIEIIHAPTITIDWGKDNTSVPAPVPPPPPSPTPPPPPPPSPAAPAPAPAATPAPAAPAPAATPAPAAPAPAVATAPADNTSPALAPMVISTYAPALAPELASESLTVVRNPSRNFYSVIAIDRDPEHPSPLKNLPRKHLIHKYPASKQPKGRPVFLPKRQPVFPPRPVFPPSVFLPPNRRPPKQLQPTHHFDVKIIYVHYWIANIPEGAEDVSSFGDVFYSYDNPNPSHDDNLHKIEFHLVRQPEYLASPPHQFRYLPEGITSSHYPLDWSNELANTTFRCSRKFPYIL